jgi:putative methyltransferase (TIGR04325 family)
MAREAQRLAGEELRFFDCIEDAASDMERVDVVFTSGALQYCSAPLDVLRQLLSLKAPSVFITRTALNVEGGRLVTVQYSDLATNGGRGPLPSNVSNRPISYPVVFESKAEFESILREDYDIRFTLKEDENAYFCGNRPINMYGYSCALKTRV